MPLELECLSQKALDVVGGRVDLVLKVLDVERDHLFDCHYHLIPIYFCSVLPREFSRLLVRNLAKIVDILVFIDELKVFSRVQVIDFLLLNRLWSYDVLAAYICDHGLLLMPLCIPHFGRERR